MILRPQEGHWNGSDGRDQDKDEAQQICWREYQLASGRLEAGMPIW